jgi:hypothetical protein
MTKVEWHGEQLAQQILQAAVDGGEEWARADVMPLADENCPTDSGTMKGTHAVIRSGPKRIEMGYGGPAAPYTLRQHEDLTLDHPSGQAKWLENAVNWQLPKLPERIKDRVQPVLR